ncbi:biotin/acetyl-CoA-carboxylase ligase [Ferroglobus placidus DSM 10642]|uniref:Biotin/acetyl-CoA-carboxylase ligase n=1 Tax=Ferroglobus placidus (strain DSM 10642 / AEDII12DO) TaxID=589924 RepID=D3RYI5_FERPA|nr:biotin--[acetyl-CoA-carboxylase] ligase [Ferroglobus placidus]ADC65548.1 biotin/acetyl-CoA-carboxylase ligase [Ferroglobus placidus DSM 10642]
MCADLAISLKDKRLKIYELLRKGYSGERIAKTLGISRSAVWKFVEKLRSLGYEIDRNYNILSIPDPSPLDAALCSKKLGVEKFLYFEEVDSTNNVAKKEERSCVLAKRQTAGRGRLGRKWESEEGGLYFSFEFPRKVPAVKAHRVTILTGLVVAKTLEKFNAKIKWPNDILIDGKKVSGILCELVGEELSSRVIVGVGINVKNELPEELKDRATTLKNYNVSITEIFCSFANNFAEVLNLEWSKILEKWRQLLDTIGKEVEVRAGSEVYRGIALDVDDEGALIVKCGDELERVFSGECFYM